MRLYNERTTKDFLWITVLYSGKVNGGPRSLNLSTTRTGATSDVDDIFLKLIKSTLSRIMSFQLAESVTD